MPGRYNTPAGGFRKVNFPGQILGWEHKCPARAATCSESSRREVPPVIRITQQRRLAEPKEARTAAKSGFALSAPCRQKPPMSFKMIERKTPPSTRRAAPFVAEESGLAMNNDERGNLVGRGEPFQERTGSNCFEELLLNRGGIGLSGCGHTLEESLDSFRARRPRQYQIDRYARSRCRLRQTARQGKLHSLGNAIVNHLHGNVDGRFARDENDPAPVLGLHLGQVVTAQPRTAHEVRFDDGCPILVRNFFEGLGLVITEIIHQDLDIWKIMKGLISEIWLAQIAGELQDLWVGTPFANPATASATRFTWRP